MKMKRQNGFSLVELMVAMVVSLVVILGAGQLFISLSQTSERITRLSEKQAAVNFAVETLLRDIRRADWLYYSSANGADRPWNVSEGVFSLYVPNRGDVSAGCDAGDMVLKHYRLTEREVRGERAWFMAVEAARCETGGGWSELEGGSQELVGGFAEGGFEVEPFDTNNSAGIGALVTLRLQPLQEGGDPDVLTFHAVNRTAAVTR